MVRRSKFRADLKLGQNPARVKDLVSSGWSAQRLYLSKMKAHLKDVMGKKGNL